MRLASLLLASLAACGPRAVDCAEVGDFAACTLDDGAAGVCLLAACTPLPDCAGAACDQPGPTFRIPDTNLRVCYGTSGDGVPDGTIDCPTAVGTPACADEPYCGSDAQYGWDAANPAEARFTRIVDGDEPTVEDAVTGLVWMACAHGQRGPGCAGDGDRVDGYTAEAVCRDATWGGFDDWVLPDAHALQSIVDYGRTAPAFDLDVFPNAPSRFAEDYEQWWIECAWTSSAYARGDDVAWAVITNNGDVSQGSGVPYHLHDRAADGWDGCTVRCVRASAAPTHGRFVALELVPGERVVADTWGGRLWQGCAAGQAGAACDGDAARMPWRDALQTCEALVWGGFDDWRLPDVKELRSLIDESRISPAVDADAFPNVPFYGADQTPNIGQFWTSTARSYNDFALYVDFGTGFSHFYVQSEGRHVRCVRGAPPAPNEE
jgi:hypothetical protein